MDEEKKKEIEKKDSKKKNDKKDKDKDEDAKFPAPDSENRCDCATCSIANLLWSGDVPSILKGDKSHH